MNIKFEKYWNDIHGIMSVAIVLDSWYKMGLVNYAFPKILGDHIAPKKVEEVKKFCLGLYQEYKLKNMKIISKG